MGAVGWQEGGKSVLEAKSFWIQDARCIFMIMHLLYFCFKNWQYVCI